VRVRAVMAAVARASAAAASAAISINAEHWMPNRMSFPRES